MCTELEIVALSQAQYRIIGLAKLAGAFDDCLESRSDIGRRGRNDLQNVGAAGLVGEGLGEVAGLGLHLVKQPHILDRDHRLVGEGRDQLDLFVGKGPHGATQQRERANRITFA